MKLSVVVPALNVEAHISKTLDSLVHQAEPFYEIVVVNDGSTDSTGSIIESYIQTNPKAGVQLITQVNQGVSVARNTGLDAVTGDFVLFLDADDLVDHDLVQSLRLAVRPHAQVPDMATWRFHHLDADANELPTFSGLWDSVPEISSGAETLTRVIREHSHWLSTVNVAYRTSLLPEQGLRFTVGCYSGQDIEFEWKAASRCRTVLWIDRYLSSYVVRAGSITHSSNPKKIDAVPALFRVADQFKDSDDCLIAGLWDDVISLALGRFMVLLRLQLRSCEDSARSVLSTIEDRHPGLVSRVRRETFRRILLGNGRSAPQALFATHPVGYCNFYRWHRGRHSA